MPGTPNSHIKIGTPTAPSEFNAGRRVFSTKLKMEFRMLLFITIGLPLNEVSDSPCQILHETLQVTGQSRRGILGLNPSRLPFFQKGTQSFLALRSDA